MDVHESFPLEFDRFLRLLNLGKVMRQLRVWSRLCVKNHRVDSSIQAQLPGKVMRQSGRTYESTHIMSLATYGVTIEVVETPVSLFCCLGYW